MKKFVALPRKEKRLRMIGKMMNLTFIEIFTAYIKIRMICFPSLLVNLFKERYISSVKSCKYLNKLISIKTMVLTFSKKTMYMCTIPLTKFQKSFTSHNIAHQMLFTHAFCHMHVQNLKKESECFKGDRCYKKY